ncbi:MAG: hypothetical protein HQK52_21570 [Oligoflexia bacterium]|nr:hypothetical protein [Oligoflexia bacterium]
MIKNFILILILLINTWAVNVLHIGVFPKNVIADKDSIEGRFYSKKETKLNHIVLEGSPYHRGREFGRLTAELLFKQEEQLVHQLNTFFPSSIIQKAFFILLIRWFWGIEKYFDKMFTDEMQGVSESTSEKFDYLGDKLTRQVAYHGLHEVGQMMMGYSHSWGCTVLGVPTNQSWIIGRNFDFEAGKIFDEEKILKWVYPDRGNAYVSVIWAGMVGVVTGINEKGIYLSLNAAGSTDFARYGAPSTLVVAKVLQTTSTIIEAIQVLKESQILITEIFVLVDFKNRRAFRIEKSPEKMDIIEQHSSFVVTNHLVSDLWKDDSINRHRKKILTTIDREMRGKKLLQNWQSNGSIVDTQRMATFLRDKKDFLGKKLALGDRRAIDALIATHSVIVDGERNYLYINEGPSLVGRYVGIDLTASFARKRPIMVSDLPADPEVPRKEQ